jgi:mRNA-degrading endonuclease YafQ of YafQ-DinJ toxin-antitoxin module
MINKLIEPLFNQIYPQIKNKEKGVLYQIIKLIIHEAKLEQLVNSQEIYHSFKIQESSELEDDFGIVYEIQESFLNSLIPFTHDIKRVIDEIKHQLKSYLSYLNPVIPAGIFENLGNLVFRNNCSQAESKKQMEILTLTLAAVFLIGLAVVGVLVLPNRNSSKAIPATKSTAICLALPAFAVFGLKQREMTSEQVTDDLAEEEIARDKIIELVEAATEFRCVEADKQIVMKTTNQEVKPDSQLKFYIRIHIEIPSENDILKEKTKYGIKDNLRNLHPDTKGKIIQLGRLTDPSDLPSFNRI